MDKAAFARVVRDHRGDWVGHDDAEVVRLFLDSTRRHHPALMDALREQVPPYELTVPAGVPVGPGVAHQVIPAGTNRHIGYVMQLCPATDWQGWHCFDLDGRHRGGQLVGGPTRGQQEAVLRVFAAHFESL